MAFFEHRDCADEDQFHEQTRLFSAWQEIEAKKGAYERDISEKEIYLRDHAALLSLSTTQAEEKLSEAQTRADSLETVTRQIAEITQSVQETQRRTNLADARENLARIEDRKGGRSSI